MCGRCSRPRVGVPLRCPSCGSLDCAAPCVAHGDRLTTDSCVVCGAPLCHACRRGPRNAALCTRHEHTRLIEGWAEVIRTADELEARFLSDELSGAGIEATILSQKDSANVVTFGGLSIVRVIVPAYLLEEARAWMEARESGSETGEDRG